MKHIDEYINEVKNKENISDGGSPAYAFEDVVLVKYSISSKYGLAREKEELIAAEANKKNIKRVNTPMHLAIKRTVEGEKNICWVLQEKARGVSFTKYSSSKNTAQEQIRLQQELLDAPSYHYEKCISDLMELFNMGIELKPKNIFYDNSSDGVGFSFIDLLNYDAKPMDSNSLSDILLLDKMVQFISNFTKIPSYDKNATDEEKDKSLELYYKIRIKIFTTIEKVVPNFSKYKRWILRTYPNDVLNYFNANGIPTFDLGLTKEEYAQFNSYSEIIVNNCIEKLSNGENKLWQIELNEIRIMIEKLGLIGTWKKHPFNQVNNENDFDDEWEYEFAVKKELEFFIKQLFYDKLYEIAKISSNPNVLKAIEEIEHQNKNKKI